jgi:biotin operon repressor
MKPQTDDELASSLNQSLQSTIKGLKLFANSLKASGFAEAAPKYRQMEIVLIQQRMWSKNKNRKELDSTWREVAGVASQIYNALYPLSEIMNQIGAIETLSQEQEETKLQTKLLKLLSSPQPISLIRLGQLLGKDKKTIQSSMQSLIKNGKVQSRGRGNGRSYCLKAATEIES